ncbi:MAG: lysylphosphatidylglycerol synthase transmembrane domain-containing protein [Ignavibacteria bacterium]
MSRKYRILFFIIGVVLFLYMIYQFGVDNIIEYIKQTGFWLIAVISVWFVIYILHTFAWSEIIRSRGAKIKLSELFAIHLSSSALNYVTPFLNLGGEPFRIMATKERLGFETSVSSTLLYNMIHILSHLIFWLISCFTALLVIKNVEIYLVVIPLIIILLSGILLFFVWHKNGIFLSFVSLSNKTFFLKPIGKFLNRKKEKLLVLDELVKDLFNNNKKAFYVSLSYELLARYISAIEFYIILFSIGYPANFLQAIYIYAGSSLILNILFFVPMEAGTREAGLYAISASLGYSPGIGVYISIVNRLREFFWIIVGLLLMQFTGTRKLEKEIL